MKIMLRWNAQWKQCPFCVLSFNLLINLIKFTPSTEMKNINKIKSVVGIWSLFCIHLIITEAERCEKWIMINKNKQNHGLMLENGFSIKIVYMKTTTTANVSSEMFSE